MTTFDTAAAWLDIKPVRMTLIAAFAALGLGGCETGGSLLSGTATDPSQTALATPSPGSGAQGARIAVAPVIGAPDSVAGDLQSQVVTALESNRIAVAKSPTDRAEYTLRGYVVSAREKKGSKISYIWDVTDQSSKRVNRITGEELVSNSGQSKDPWAAVTPQVIKKIADKTASSVTAWLPTASAPAVASAAPTTGAVPVRTAAAGPPDASIAANASPTTGSISRDGPVSTLVPNVVGAPGDGGESLTGAIRRELTKNGVTLAEQPTNQTYTVEGRVSMGANKDGKQPIVIDWNVKDPKGKKLGTVSQKNEVVQGSLDGTWGKTADAAAAAAAQGILKLLPKQQRTSSAE